MKIKNLLLATFAIVASTITVNAQKTIVDVAVGSKDHTTLVAAVNLLFFDEAFSLISSVTLGSMKDAFLFFDSALVGCRDIAFSFGANLVSFKIIMKKILFLKKNFDTCIFAFLLALLADISLSVKSMKYGTKDSFQSIRLK